MYELPKTIPDVKMLLGPEELGSPTLFLLKKVDFKSFNANGAIVRCPLTVNNGPLMSLTRFFEGHPRLVSC
jgi:hypothetical protein